MPKNWLNTLLTGKAKEQAAFYDTYKGRLYAICLRYARTTAEAEDILQESFLKIFKSLPKLKDETKIEGYIKRITARTAIDYYRKEMRYNFVQLEDYHKIEDGGLETINQLTVAEIKTYIKLLPMGYRTVFNLFFIDQWTHKEIAEEMGITIGTSKSQLSKAKKLFFKICEDKKVQHYE